jgi:hypothetical protein
MTEILKTCVHNASGWTDGPCVTCELNEIKNRNYMRETLDDGTTRLRGIYSPGTGVAEPDQTDLEISLLKEQLARKTELLESTEAQVASLIRERNNEADLATAEGLVKDVWRAFSAMISEGAFPELRARHAAFLNRDAPKLTLHKAMEQMPSVVVSPTPVTPRCQACGDTGRAFWRVGEFKPPISYPCPDCTEAEVKT